MAAGAAPRPYLAGGRAAADAAVAVVHRTSYRAAEGAVLAGRVVAVGGSRAAFHQGIRASENKRLILIFINDQTKIY